MISKEKILLVTFWGKAENAHARAMYTHINGKFSWFAPQTYKTLIQSYITTATL